MEFIKKHKDYFYVAGLSLLVFLIIFTIKGIYPFGNNSVIYGDMYEQVTSFFYYFRDSIHGSSSLLVNFNASNGINFFGIFAYYIFSPFTLLTLLVKRSEIYLLVSIIVALKIVICNITAMYMLKKLFKDINSLLCVMLALLYGFCAYSLNYYQITAWIDVMYMLPLIIIGLKNLFELNNPKLYIISLFFAICMSFYISAMVIIFIFLISLIYLLVYNKKNIGKNILSLGISTIASIGASAIILLPTLKQYLASSRKIEFLETLLNSKTGPLGDKIVLFLFGAIIFVALLLLLKDFKKHKKFLLFYLPTMILLLIPVLCEPVNKLLHFGSYYFFTYRFGFITTLFLIIGAGYYFNQAEIKEYNPSILAKIISIIGVISILGILVILTHMKYGSFQKYIELLSLSSNKMLLLILIAMFALVFIGNIIILIINKGLNKFSIAMLFILSLIHITINSYIFIGLDFVQDNNKLVYEDLNKIYEDKDSYDIFKYKDETGLIIKNSSNVTGLASMDAFSSLTGASNQDSLKSLGYTSFQSRTHSMGGTLFSDILLANKYVINKDENKEFYTLKKQYNHLYVHELNEDISYGYLINNDANLNDLHNTFAIQNSIYKSITNEDNLFKIVDNYKLNNIEIKDNVYKVLDKNNAFIEYTINIEKQEKIYLEILGGLNFSDNRKIFKNFDIYVNNVLVKENYPELNDNGVLDLGTYENETVIIKIMIKKDSTLESLNVGLLNLELFNSFIKDYKLNYDISFNKNNVDIKINSNADKILFLPLNYSKGIKATNNNEKIEVVKVFNNYIGIKLKQGENNIHLNVMPESFYPALIISIIFIILIAVLFINNDLYQKLIGIKVLQIGAKIIYLVLYIVLLVSLYLLPILGFLISFVKYITI